MRTYDPADRICYVHLAPGARPAPPVERLDPGYANDVLRARLAVAAPRTPVLVVIPGGAEPTAAPAPVLRLA